MCKVSNAAMKLLSKIRSNPNMEIDPSDIERSSLLNELLAQELVLSANPSAIAIPLNENNPPQAAHEYLNGIKSVNRYIITQKGEQCLRTWIEEKKEKHKDVCRAWLQFFLGLFIGWILGGYTFSDCLALIERLFV